jgi:hypothetical protein
MKKITKKTTKATATKATRKPTAAHGAARAGRAAKATKPAAAATGAATGAATVAASRLAEDALSEGARADLARVRAAASEPDPALDAAVANAGKARAGKHPALPGGKKPKKASLLDLAAEVLIKAGKPMGCGEVVAEILAAGTWQTKGKTPAATLYSAIIREIADPRRGSRFRKVGKGQFETSTAKVA